MFKKFMAFDKFLERELPLLLLLLLLIVLRIPNLFEPYWYGDEGIYLTLGVAMRNGARLYAEIIDHKTPIIYYLALVPDQFWFRVLNIGWMIATTIAFYHLALKITKKLLPTIISSFFFVIFTTLPWFEGNVPNGELFVMGFVLWGGLFLLYTKFFGQFFKEDIALSTKLNGRFTHPFQQALGNFLNNSHDIVLYLLAGLLFGLGILTKVPAVMDAVSFLAIGWFTITNAFSFEPRHFKKWLSTFVATVLRLMVITIGVIIPIIGSVIYFNEVGSGQAYLDFGLLYNFRYIQAWGLPFTNELLLYLFTLPGKFLVAAGVILLLSAFRKWISPAFQFVASWFVLSVFAALLSNRPYPHYFQQSNPAMALLIGLLLTHLLELLRGENNLMTLVKRFSLKKLNATFPHLLMTSTATVLLVGFASILLLLNVGLYETGKYYKNSISYLFGKMDRDSYYQSFNELMTDNYAAAEIITKTDDPYLFIWGTNPSLYSLTQKAPTGRFTVSFHIKDFNAQEETLNDLTTKLPRFIVIMRDEETELPGLNDFMSLNYIMNSNFEHFELWKRL